MKKLHIIKTCNILFFYFILLFTFIGITTYAAPNGSPLTTYPDINLVSPEDFSSDKPIPEEYATVLRPSSKLTYTVSGANRVRNSGDADEYYEFLPRNIQGSTPCYIQANNVAIYKGNIIDLRINILPESTATYVYLYTPTYSPSKNMENFLRIDVANRNKHALINYEFYIHDTNQKIDFSGNWNYAWINNYKGITQSLDQVKDIYAYNIYPSAARTPVYYDTNFIPGNNITIYGKNNRQDFLLENAYSILFDTTNGTLSQRIDVLNGTRGWTKYSASPITKMDLPSPQIIGNTTNYSDIKFTANQDMNSQSREDFYPKDYTMSIKLKDADVLDWENTNIKITDVSGASTNTIDSYFKVEKDINNNQLAINVNQNTLKSTSFVNNSYFFEVNGKLKNTTDINKYYKSDGYFYVPVYVQYVTDTNTSVENMSYAKIKSDFTATPITQTVAQDSSTADWNNKQLTDLFSKCNPPLQGENVVITNIEDVKFSELKDYFVKITLKSETTDRKAIFEVPVKVKAKKTAEINYLDINGNKISDSIEKFGFEEQSYDFTTDIKDIHNYKFLKVDNKPGNSPIKGNYPKTTETDKIIINIIYETLESKMTIRQVYKDNHTKAIYNDLNNQTTVNNGVTTHNEIIGASIQEIIDSIKTDTSYGIVLNYDWYLPVDSKKDYIVLVDGEQVTTDKVPEGDFELLILYTGLMKIEASDLDYGQIKITAKDNTLYNNPNTDQKLKVINTDLDVNWNLMVSLEGTIKKGTQDYLGGLLFEKNGQSKIINQTATTFSTQSEQINPLISSIPMNVKLFQNVGNSIGKYEGTVIWSLQDTPIP